MADRPALLPDTTPPGIYRPRGTSSVQRLFPLHFGEIVARYETDFAARLGWSRLKRFSSAVERFLGCGDYTKGIARIRCSKTGCKTEYSRRFSCKVFHLCPSCSQKRTLLFGEYADEHLLLRLPHRQIVSTFPRVLRVFFRLDRRLFGEVSRLAYRMIQHSFTACAGRRIQTAAVAAYASAGVFVRFSPHLHGLFLDGGFDRKGRFVHVPSLDSAKLAQAFRTAMVTFFLRRQLINERLARKLERKLDALDAMPSQFFEGGANGGREPIPADDAGREVRRQTVRKGFRDHAAGVASDSRAKLLELYGEEKGRAAKAAESFEVCE